MNVQRTSRFLFSSLFFMIAAVLVSSPSEAKDLNNRLGLGFKNQFSSELPGIAVQYYPSAELGLSGILAVDTQTNNSRFGAMVRVYRVIFMEDNLNFYMGAGAGLLSNETAGRNESGFEIAGFGGAEFFFAGLDNLGFSFETGAAITSLSSSVRFRTLGDHPLRAGMIFYF